MRMKIDTEINGCAHILVDRASSGRNTCQYRNCRSVVADEILWIKMLFSRYVMKELDAFQMAQEVRVCHAGPYHPTSSF